MARNPGIQDIWYAGIMESTRIGRKGQVSIPKAVMERLGLTHETLLLVETTEDGAIVLRPAGVYPVEMYDDARVAELMEEDAMTAEETGRVRRTLEGP